MSKWQDSMIILCNIFVVSKTSEQCQNGKIQ
jgi:hypothetical protein